MAIYNIILDADSSDLGGINNSGGYAFKDPFNNGQSDIVNVYITADYNGTTGNFADIWLDNGDQLNLIIDPAYRDISEVVEVRGDSSFNNEIIHFQFNGGAAPEYLNLDGGLSDTAGGAWDGTYTVTAGLPPDYVVEGTAGDDVIDVNYEGDPEGDQIDNSDNAAGNNDDVIEAGAGNDTIMSGDGDDQIYAGAGDDTINGGAGQDCYIASASSVGSRSYMFVGTEAYDQAGLSVSSAGDVDGDGLDDLFVGARRADGGGSDAGEAYLVTAANLAAADAADGTSDGVIDLDNINEQSTSYQFIGTEVEDNASYSISSAGDVDGDGLDDLLIGAPRADGGGDLSGEVYLVTAANLAAADAADGTSDGVIDLDNINEQSKSYQFIGTELSNHAGFSVSSAGDVNGDGFDDLLIGAPGAAGSTSTTIADGEVYLVSAVDLVAADAADGNADGVIDLDNINEQSTSYQFLGESDIYNNSALFGFNVSSAGDVDGDGLDDIFISAARDNGGDTVGANGIASGEAYLVTAADLAAADAADGTTDHVININNITDQSTSYQFNGTESGEQMGQIASAGDVDGDGLDDLIFGAGGADGGGSTSGETYLITAADLAAADAADGTTDHVIDLDNLNEQPNSYQFMGTFTNDQLREVSSAGDVDGDGLDDMLFGAWLADGSGYRAGEVYLVTAADLAAADGNADGVIDLDNINEQSTSYQFLGAETGDVAGFVSSAGDVDGDGKADLLIGAPGSSAGGVSSGASYVIRAADLEAADLADGIDNNIINLGNIAGLNAGTPISSTPGISVNVNNDGDGTVTGEGNDTVTSVECYMAGEDAPDDITISASDGGYGFNSSEISGLDDNSEGTYTPAGGGAPIAFGPTEALQLSDILAGLDAGTYGNGEISVTGGDETGQVGNISFENFETINFNVEVVCFAKGTLITSAQGDVPIEALKIGDDVLTADHGYQPIRWIGHTKKDSIDLALNPKLKPVCISAGALGAGLPKQDLIVSRQHRILVRSQIARRMFGQSEILLPAIKLIDLPGIFVMEDVSEVVYYHMLFDRHEIVNSNGAQSESLFTGPEALKAVGPEARYEILCLFPELNTQDYRSVPARFIPERGKFMKQFVHRHHKNQKPLVL